MLIPDQLYHKILEVMPIPCVDLLVTDKQGKVLLLKRKNEPAKGQWWFPGGRVYFGETRRAAAIRKLKEECGLVGETVIEIGTYEVILDMPAMKGRSHGITTLFYIQIQKDERLTLDHHSEEGKWLKVVEWQRKKLHSFILTSLNICNDQ